MNRFRKKFKNRNHQRERSLRSIYNKLMQDPENNIVIRAWESEEVLREKADIHRARLNKFGKSKMNNEMIFLGPKGGIYKVTSKGNKIYI